MNTFPRTINVVHAGFRAGATQKRVYKYFILNEDGNPVEEALVFNKRMGSATGIGVVLRLEQVDEDTFRCAAAEYVEWTGNRNETWRNRVAQWRAEQDAVENSIQMERKLQGEDAWEHSLSGIKRAYHGMNRSGRAAIIGKLIMYLDAP